MDISPPEHEPTPDSILGRPPDEAASPRQQGRKVRSSDCARCVIMRSLVRAGLPSETRELICQRMWLNRVRARQILFAEGNRASHLYAVRRGRVKLARVDAGGREHITAILGSGDLFGFEAVFDSAYRGGAEALTEGELCLASGAELKELMDAVPHFAVDLARYLHHQLDRTRQRQSYLCAVGAQSKLAGYLLSELEDAPAADGDPVVPRRLTLRDLGALLGLSPETVCRTLGTLKRRGVTAPVGEGIRVCDLDALRRLAAS